MYLTRFYDQIDDAQQVMFSNELMLVAGTREMMMIQHSISRFLLKNFLFKKDAWQEKYYASVYGASNVQQIYFKGVTSSANSYYLTTYPNKIQFSMLSKSMAGLSCMLNAPEAMGRHSILVLANMTGCG